MGAAIEVKTDLTLKELEALYLKASTTFEQRRAHVILLRAEGKSPSEVAQITRLHPRTISNYVHRFNQEGPASLLDARAERNGRDPLLDQDALDQLEAALAHPPQDGGRWSGPKVTRWMEQYLGREARSMDNAMGWRALKLLNYSYKSNRPQHVKSASEEERGQWKKKSRAAL